MELDSKKLWVRVDCSKCEIIDGMIYTEESEVTCSRPEGKKLWVHMTLYDHMHFKRKETVKK